VRHAHVAKPDHQNTLLCHFSSPFPILPLRLPTTFP
jgi:hypothetical protein